LERGRQSAGLVIINLPTGDNVSVCVCVCGKKGRSWPSKVGWREVHVGTGGCEMGIEGRRKKWRRERWD